MFVLRSFFSKLSYLLTGFSTATIMPFDSLKFGGNSLPSGGKRERSNATAAADKSGNIFCSICVSDALNVGNDVIFLLSVDFCRNKQQHAKKSMRGRERKKI